jgi:hypothetical protein
LKDFRHLGIARVSRLDDQREWIPGQGFAHQVDLACRLVLFLQACGSELDLVGARLHARCGLDRCGLGRIAAFEN